MFRYIFRQLGFLVLSCTLCMAVKSKNIQNKYTKQTVSTLIEITLFTKMTFTYVDLVIFFFC